MTTGYVRQSAADIIPGAQVKAAPVNAEFNQLQSAFSASTGHKHDGSTGQGPYISILSDSDNDTYINVETTTDEDIVRVVVNGVNVALVTTAGVIPATGGTLNVGTTANPVSFGFFDVFRVNSITISTAATLSSGALFTINGNVTLSTAGVITLNGSVALTSGASFTVPTPTSANALSNKAYVDSIAGSASAASAAAAAAQGWATTAANSAAAAAQSALDAQNAVGAVRVTTADTSAQTLNDKLVAGNNISLVVQSTGSVETLLISLTSAITLTRVEPAEALFSGGSEYAANTKTQPTTAQEVSGTLTTVAFKDNSSLWYVLGGNATLPVTLSTTAVGGGLDVVVQQNNTAGFNFIVTKSTGTTAVKIGDLDFTAMTTGAKAYVSIWQTADDTLFYSSYYNTDNI